MIKRVEDLSVKIFADGADKEGMMEMYSKPFISGFTTNPTLMRKAGLSDYLSFAREIVELIKDKPLSFEVFSDDLREMEIQALKLADLAPNVFVKIPITNTFGESCFDVVKNLSDKGIKINVTAIMTIEQVNHIIPALSGGAGGYISVFAGRIADTGIDPIPMMSEIIGKLYAHNNIELIWASPRELLNIVQAHEIGCDIITVTNDILKKLSLLGKDLSEFSLDTVKMFYNDAKASGFSLD
ncbi:MAG: transaldolase [Bacteroidetes bacterium]|nr:transaldolase [Bacteroidota bacterium]